MIVVAITGASGTIYAVKLLEVLKKLNIETGLVVSNPAKIVMNYELGTDSNTNFDIDLDYLKSLATNYYESNDLTASINSGSFKFDSVVIVPCSMKTVSAIANSYCDNSISRVADVALKERRPLIIVPRETPLRTAHLENMGSISKEGGIILPAMPAFYHNPNDLNDIYDFIVGKILDSLKIDNNEFKRWNPNGNRNCD